MPGGEHSLPPAAARGSGTARHTGLSCSTAPQRLLRVPALAGSRLRRCSSSPGFSGSAGGLPGAAGSGTWPRHSRPAAGRRRQWVKGRQRVRQSWLGRGLGTGFIYPPLSFAKCHPARPRHGAAGDKPSPKRREESQDASIAPAAGASGSSQAVPFPSWPNKGSAADSPPEPHKRLLSAGLILLLLCGGTSSPPRALFTGSRRRRQDSRDGPSRSVAPRAPPVPTLAAVAPRAAPPCSPRGFAGEGHPLACDPGG